jgi:hypothetical protein
MQNTSYLKSKDLALFTLLIIFGNKELSYFTRSMTVLRMAGLANVYRG